MALMITGADGKEVQYTGGSNLSSRTGNREDDSMLSAVEKEMARLEAEQKRKERTKEQKDRRKTYRTGSRGFYCDMRLQLPDRS